MSNIRVTPMVVKALAGQVGFRRLRITDGSYVESLISIQGRMFAQHVGQVRDVQKLIDFCRREGIEIEDDRLPPIPAWAEDPWVAFGA